MSDNGSDNVTDDVRSANRRAWNKLAESGNRWTVPVSAADVERARRGDWSVVLTPTKPVPKNWFGDLAGAEVLGLASGGGQQCPLFAAAGARVTLLDNSPAQLDRDRQVAERDGLDIRCVEGDMADLGEFADASFDLVFHPVSNCFVPDVCPVWREVYRVLRPGGAVLAGFINPVAFIFDDAKLGRGELEARHRIPYSDLTSISADERRALYGDDEPLTFGHSLGDQIGGQVDAGLAITGFYEDVWANDHPLNHFLPTFIATRATRADAR